MKFHVFDVTALAVPTLHKFVVGAVVVATQFELQHTQFCIHCAYNVTLVVHIV
ncbi:MAG: hypothetical protein Q8S84_06080 [bacterium]|nr:hypothetical protein [bacterium]